MLNHYVNETPIDYHLAQVYFGLLLELAKKQQRITYGELVALAQSHYPEDEIVQNAIAVSVGRRLEIVYRFTQEHEFPDLTVLAYNKGTEECGAGLNHQQPQLLQDEVYAFDWNAVDEAFEQHLLKKVELLGQKKAAVKKVKLGRSEDEARTLMWAYYKEHKTSLPASIKNQRETLIALIQQGMDAESAFQQCAAL